jgi:hypothetical protein
VANKDPSSVKIFCVGDKSRGFMQRFLKVKRKTFLFYWVELLSIGAAVASVVTGIFLGQILTLMRSVFSDPYRYR